MILRGVIIWILCASPALADILVPTRTIRSHTIISPLDLTVKTGDLAGALRFVDQAVGLETRVVLYAGRPIRPRDLGAPALIERNQIVVLVYQRGGLRISTDARSLARGGVGDVVRVMNLNSRTTISGRVAADGSVIVGP